MTAREIIQHMESLQNDRQRQILMGFFKTGPGEYGEGDAFLGLKVPQTREVVRAVASDFPLNQVPELLMNRWHEVRLCGLLIMVSKFENSFDVSAICRAGKQLGPRRPLCSQDSWPLALVAVLSGR